MFKKATKEQSRLRMAIHGPSGSGKTYSALAIATAMIEGTDKRIALLDTERGSASKYADRFDFDVCEVTGDYHPDKAGKIIDEAAGAGYGVIVVDSGTHFWNGDGGFLQLVDQEAKRAAARGGRYDSFGAWKAIDPIYQRFVQKITSAPIHVIFTLRAKQSYESVKDDNGKTKIQKLGLAPQMRDDFQYEFDVEGMMSLEHDLAIGKTRCNDLDGRVFHKPGKDVAGILMAWLTSGAPMRVEEPKASPATQERHAPTEEPERTAPAQEPTNEEPPYLVMGLLDAIDAVTSREQFDAVRKTANEDRKKMSAAQREKVAEAIKMAAKRIEQEAAA